MLLYHCLYFGECSRFSQFHGLAFVWMKTNLSFSDQSCRKSKSGCSYPINKMHRYLFLCKTLVHNSNSHSKQTDDYG